MTLIRCALVSLALCVSWAFAQPAVPALGFQHITVLDGLSQNAVHDIAQDLHGFLWFATEDGLNRYDGYTFTVYRRAFDTALPVSAAPDPEQPLSDYPGLSDSLVQTLFVDSAGILWVGTANGLNRYNEASDSFQHYALSAPAQNGSTPFSVTAIVEGRDGQLWIGASPGGLVRLDRSSGRQVRVWADAANPAALSSDRITSIAVAQDGWLWVGTGDAGLNRLNPETGEVQRYSHDGQRNDVSSGSRISALAFDHRGMLWIATEDAGLSQLDPATGSVQRYRHAPDDPHSLSSDSLRMVFEDSQQNLWIGHRPNGGLDQFDRESNRFRQYLPSAGDELALSDTHVISAFEDTSGILWFGTSVGGVNKLDPSYRRFSHFKHRWWASNSLSDNTVRAFHKEGDKLYVGTAGGLNVLDLSTGEFTHYRHNPQHSEGIPHDVVRDIARDPSGDLWLATHGGLSRFSPETERFINYFHDPQDPQSLSVDNIWRVHVDREGMVWAGSRAELNRLDPRTGRVQRFQASATAPGSFPEDWLFAIHEDRQGDLWFGASRFDRATETFRSYAPAVGQPAPLSNAFVMSIAEDSDGTLWFGTRGGLNRLDDPESGLFTAFTSADGLPNDVIYGILFDDTNALWLSTNRGLARLDPRTGAVDQFDVSHGLQANEFNNGAYYRAETGEMYFGGINGFNVFQPDQIQAKDYQPPLVITRFTVANQDRQRGSSLAGEDLGLAQVLSHRENYVSFEFAALDYSAPQRIRYQYRLHGVDENWVNAGHRRFASYTNLAPGSYRFEARGTNSDGLWSGHTAVLAFHVTPALWQRDWFRLLLAVIIAVGVLMIYRYQMVRIRRRNLALQALVAERTAKLEQANATLHSEIHQRQIAEEEIRKIAYHDYLTGLPNRRLFASLCEQALASAAREGQRGALFFVDVDGFKAINDRLGHEAGDVALVSVASRIRSVIRESDVACRMGGDEFVLLMKGIANRDSAAHVAEKLVATIAAPTAVDSGGDEPQQSVTISVSIGICLYPDEGSDLETLLSKADQAMYAAKNAGLAWRFWHDLAR